jgi:4a-hydroxytetrahydrobiopterin dehydratase
MTTTTIQPTFSAGSDATSLTASLSTLLPPEGRWQLTPKGNGVERTFRFKTFKKTWVCSYNTAVPIQVASTIG